mmetsp:Transcript_9610/g.20646  ORF Transcript_9610/g.20646 Transcript_9610/m.20646 type:complete len:374 (-) Transcript_9610:506-1627(-)
MAVLHFHSQSTPVRNSDNVLSFAIPFLPQPNIFRVCSIGLGNVTCDLNAIHNDGLVARALNRSILAIKGGIQGYLHNGESGGTFLNDNSNDPREELGAEVGLAIANLELKVSLFGTESNVIAQCLAIKFEPIKSDQVRITPMISIVLVAVSISSCVVHGTHGISIVQLEVIVVVIIIIIVRFLTSGIWRAGGRLGRARRATRKGNTCVAITIITIQLVLPFEIVVIIVVIIRTFTDLKSEGMEAAMIMQGRLFDTSNTHIMVIIIGRIHPPTEDFTLSIITFWGLVVLASCVTLINSAQVAFISKVVHHRNTEQAHRRNFPGALDMKPILVGDGLIICTQTSRPLSNQMVFRFHFKGLETFLWMFHQRTAILT